MSEVIDRERRFEAVNRALLVGGQIHTSVQNQYVDERTFQPPDDFLREMANAFQTHQIYGHSLGTGNDASSTSEQQPKIFRTQNDPGSDGT
jgi:hypothetical protein